MPLRSEKQRRAASKAYTQLKLADWVLHLAEECLDGARGMDIDRLRDDIATHRTNLAETMNTIHKLLGLEPHEETP